LNALNAEMAALAQALGLEQRRSADLTTRLGELDATLTDTQEQLAEQETLILSLRRERDAGLSSLADAEIRITGFEAQVAALLAERDHGAWRCRRARGKSTGSFCHSRRP
jgi:chemotaxis protein MotB